MQRRNHGTQLTTRSTRCADSTAVQTQVLSTKRWIPEDDHSLTLASPHSYPRRCLQPCRTYGSLRLSVRFRLIPSCSQDFFYTICIFIPIGESAYNYSDYRELIVSWTVILGTDAALCFGQEVECIWKRRFSLITVVYAVQRYASIVENVLGYVDPYTLTVRICFCET